MFGDITTRHAQRRFRAWRKKAGIGDAVTSHSLRHSFAQAIYELEDSPWNADEAHNRVWTFFEDFREGDWMAGDRINSTRAIREALEAEKACTPTHCRV